MWKSLLFALVLVSGALLAAPLGAAQPRESLLVTPDWLAAHLSDRTLVILHAGNAASYAQGHIPGARLADVAQVSVEGPHGLSVELPPAGVLRQKLEALGISDNSRILVYSASPTIPRATRVLLTLRAAGFAGRCFLLNGGLEAWKNQGLPVTTKGADVVPGRLKPLTFQPLALRAVIVDADFVKARLGRPGMVLIDARAPEFYSGEKPSMGGRGHIPGARNIAFTAVTGADGRLKPARELRRMFAAAGYRPGDRVIVYCHVGIQGTAVVFAARTLGMDGRLYDGSFQD
ncbi:MAG: sulfurtransferase, partial [Rhizomicrobium sp.]